MYTPSNICCLKTQSAQSGCRYEFLHCCSPAAIDQNAAGALTATLTSTLAATDWWNKHIMYFPVGLCHLPLTAHNVCGFHCFVHPARLCFISLRPLFMLQPALQFCAPRRASSLHLFWSFQLCIAALARLQKASWITTGVSVPSRAESQSHLNLNAAPSASPSHIYLFSPLLQTDAWLDFFPPTTPLNEPPYCRFSHLC